MSVRTVANAVQTSLAVLSCTKNSGRGNGSINSRLKTGCLGNCNQAQRSLSCQNVYLGEVKEKDIPDILDMLR